MRRHVTNINSPDRYACTVNRKIYCLTFELRQLLVTSVKQLNLVSLPWRTQVTRGNQISKFKKLERETMFDSWSAHNSPTATSMTLIIQWTGYQTTKTRRKVARNRRDRSNARCLGQHISFNIARSILIIFLFDPAKVAVVTTFSTISSYNSDLPTPFRTPVNMGFSPLSPLKLSGLRLSR